MIGENIIFRNAEGLLLSKDKPESIYAWLADYILNYWHQKTETTIEKFLTVTSSSINEVLSVLYSKGQFDLLIEAINHYYFIDSIKVKQFVVGHQLYRFNSIYKNFNAKIKNEISLKPNTEFKYLDDENLINLFGSVNPDKDLEKYINIYSEILSRDNEVFYPIQSKQKNYPLLSFFHLDFIRLKDEVNYFGYALSDNSLLGNYIFKDYVLSKDKKRKVEMSNDILNKIYRLVEPKYWLATLSEFKFSDAHSNFVSKALLNQSDFRLNINNGRNLPYAICLSGQLRGANECLDFWFSFARKNNIPIFISTWRSIGTALGSHGDKGSRLIPDKYKTFFSSLSTEEIFDLFPGGKNLINNDSSQLIKQFKSKYPSVEVETVIHDDMTYKGANLPANLVNQGKMFFNIQYVLSMMSNYEFTRNLRFKNVIWARPDLDIKEFKPEIIKDNKIMTSFLGSGSACGDLLIQVNRNYVSFMADLKEALTADNPFFSGAGPKLLGNSAIFSGLYMQQFTNKSLTTSGLRSPQISESIILEEIGNYNGYNQSLLDLRTISEILKSFKIQDYKTAIDKFHQLKSTYNFLADNYKDRAIKLESLDINLALSLMEIALKIRPNGPLILKKYNEYKLKLEKNEKTNS